MPAGNPSNTAVVGQVIKHWPVRVKVACCSASVESANSRTLAPGRPSSVSAGSIQLSKPTSASQAITEQPYPQASFTAVCNQRRLIAVMISRVNRMPKASANEFSMGVEWMIKAFTGQMRRFSMDDVWI